MKNWLIAFLLILVWGCTDTPQTSYKPSPTAKSLFSLRPTYFTNLTNWRNVDHSQSFIAFQKTCNSIKRYENSRTLSQSKYWGTTSDWDELCKTQSHYTPVMSTSFFEQYFYPVKVIPADTSDKGMFTGYYEPVLYGSYVRSAQFPAPLYAPPASGGKLPSRAEIVGGALDGRMKPILWVKSEIDSFFLHIQGSGRVILPNGKMLKVAYAGQNGHPYYAIGKYLIEQNYIPKGQMSARAIKIWLRDHPDLAQYVMNKNPSYVFFKLKSDNLNHLAVGAAGVPLTSEYSMAVDRTLYPYGVPIWVETLVTVPENNYYGKKMGFHRLMIAQDTGGAIKGPVRGDVFFGTGDHAEFMASHLTSAGDAYVLLPKKAIVRAGAFNG